MIHNPIRKALPDLSNPGAASDLRSGKQLVGADGSIVTGTLPEVIQATPTISVSSGGLITASATQSGGIVEGGTKSSTEQLTTQGAKTVTPGTTEQIAVPTQTYTTGAVKVVGDANLKAENIAEGVSIFGVAGTHAGGGISEVRGIYLSDGAVNSLSIEPPTNNIIYFRGDYLSNSYNDIVIVGKGQTVTVGQVNYSLSSDGATFLRESPSSGGGGSRTVYALIALD